MSPATPARDAYDTKAPSEAGADRLVNPAGSRAFAQAAPPAVVQSHCFEDAFHELFNETPEYATPVLQMLQDWLLARFGVKY